MPQFGGGKYVTSKASGTNQKGYRVGNAGEKLVQGRGRKGRTG